MWPGLGFNWTELLNEATFKGRGYFNILLKRTRGRMQNTAGIHVARQSAFDKAKAEAKAKRLRDEKEAASVLEDFVKEFNADVSDDEHAEWTVGGVEGGLRHSSSQSVGARVSMGGARRHFTAPRQVLAHSSIGDNFA